MQDNYTESRRDMVKKQIQSRGINNPLVVKAMENVPRHEFVPENFRPYAYEDRPLSIGHGQTISQPYIVAFMTQALRLGGGERVLEIGTGLGYQAAVLGEIASEVYTVEYLTELADQARNCLSRLNYSNVTSTVGDGSEGWPEHSPYMGIIATASGPSVPQTLKDQLAVGGKLVMPVGNYRFGQYILRLTKGYYGDFQEERLLDVAFVPLRGKYGWNED